MSYFVCPERGKETEVFRQGGGQQESGRLGIPLLGTIPLDPVVCDAGDTGVPLALSQPNTKTTQEMHKVAAAVSKILGRHSAPAPIKILNSHATLRSRTSVPPAPSGETAGGG